MEALSRIMTATMHRGFLDGFSVGSRSNARMVASHMLFADDTLIFCEANCEHLCKLRCLFLCFEAVSGLKINLLKLEIIPIGEVDDVESLASIGCRVALLPMKYLGSSFGGAIPVNFYLEWYRRKNGKAVGGLEEAIFVEGR
jgi:hypothetical protein